MLENLETLDALISKCAYLRDTTELVQILGVAIHSDYFEDTAGFKAAQGLHYCLQKQSQELLDGMNQLYAKISVEEKARTGKSPVFPQMQK